MGDHLGIAGGHRQDEGGADQNDYRGGKADQYLPEYDHMRQQDKRGKVKEAGGCLSGGSADVIAFERRR
jgi:hypothetical protein